MSESSKEYFSTRKGWFDCSMEEKTIRWILRDHWTCIFGKMPGSLFDMIEAFRDCSELAMRTIQECKLEGNNNKVLIATKDTNVCSLEVFKQKKWSSFCTSLDLNILRSFNLFLPGYWGVCHHHERHSNFLDQEVYD